MGPFHVLLTYGKTDPKGVGYTQFYPSLSSLWAPVIASRDGLNETLWDNKWNKTSEEGKAKGGESRSRKEIRECRN